jgi:hypothetical protein
VRRTFFPQKGATGLLAYHCSECWAMDCLRVVLFWGGFAGVAVSVDGLELESVSWILMWMGRRKD